MKRTILITGSTDGIGKLAAIRLAKEGHYICLHGRNSEKLTAVIREIRASANNEDIRGFVADFSDLEAVEKMAIHIHDQLPKIDVLINNAGVFNSPTRLTKDGLDTRFVVNYLAPYKLTNRLIPLLQKGTEPRIINLSSAAQAPVDFRVLMGQETSSIQETYAQSKLALTMWSFYLAKEFQDITVIAVNPGSLLNTKMVREAYGHHWSPVDKGANILYDLAVSRDHKNVTGKYFDNDKGGFSQAHPDAYDQTKVQELIKKTDLIFND